MLAGCDHGDDFGFGVFVNDGSFILGDGDLVLDGVSKGEFNFCPGKKRRQGDPHILDGLAAEVVFGLGLVEEAVDVLRGDLFDMQIADVFGEAAKGEGVVIDGVLAEVSFAGEPVAFECC